MLKIDTFQGCYNADPKAVLIDDKNLVMNIRDPVDPAAKRCGQNGYLWDDSSTSM